MVTQKLFSNEQPYRDIKDVMLISLEVEDESKSRSVFDVSCSIINGGDTVVYTDALNTVKFTITKPRKNPCIEGETESVTMRAEIDRTNRSQDFGEKLTISIDGTKGYTFHLKERLTSSTSIYEGKKEIVLNEIRSTGLSKYKFLVNATKGFTVDENVITSILDGRAEVFIDDILVASVEPKMKLSQGSIVTTFVGIPNVTAGYLVLCQKRRLLIYYVVTNNMGVEPSIVADIILDELEYDEPVFAATHSNKTSGIIFYSDHSINFSVDPSKGTVSIESPKKIPLCRAAWLDVKDLKVTSRKDFSLSTFTEEETRVSDNVANVYGEMIFNPEYISTASADVVKLDKVMQDIGLMENIDLIVLRNTVSKKLGEY